MSSTLTFLVIFGLQMPPLQSIQPIDWQPRYVDQEQIEICRQTVGFFTHCSWGFDPLGSTKSGIDRSAAVLKSAGWPLLYLHDRYNASNPAWCYVYDDWNPEAFVSSDIGHFRIDLSGVRHAVCHGGFFGQCERATVGDVVTNWQLLGAKGDLRITQVVDAIFTVAQFLPNDDPVATKIRATLVQRQGIHPKAVMTVEEVMLGLQDPMLQVEYLKRQLPPLPYGVNVVIDLCGEVTELNRHSKEAATLTFAYCRSERILNFAPVQLEWPEEPKSKVIGGFTDH